MKRISRHILSVVCALITLFYLTSSQAEDTPTHDGIISISAKGLIPTAIPSCFILGPGAPVVISVTNTGTGAITNITVNINSTDTPYVTVSENTCDSLGRMQTCSFKLTMTGNPPLGQVACRGNSVSAIGAVNASFSMIVTSA